MGENAAVRIKEPDKRSNKASRYPSPVFLQSTSSPIDDLFFLQRTVGNQAVQGLFKWGGENRLLTKLCPGAAGISLQRQPKGGEEKKGAEKSKMMPADFVIDLSTPVKNPEPDYSKNEDELGVWEKAVFLSHFEFAYATEAITMPDKKQGSYVSTVSAKFVNPEFSVRIASELLENSKFKPTGERTTWITIHSRVRRHAYVHIDRYRDAAKKMENEIHKSFDNLPTVDTPLPVSKADLDSYMESLGLYLSARVAYELWKTTCDWEKEDYPRLLKGIPNVSGILKVACDPRPDVPAIPLLPVSVRAEMREPVKKKRQSTEKKVR
ncbi:MAG TPA: hypothetical protein VK448_02505 [Dissulfurispiraceae bacterium]|nr:hypothetical protein [Dissulfurispiraceae bacterium]